MNDLAKKLFNMGLSEYEANVYCQLIRADKQTASMLAKSSKVPQTKIYSVLERLVVKEMCYETKGKTKLYDAIHPIDALNDIVGGFKNKYNEAQDIAKDLSEIYAERNKKTSAEDEFEILHTPSIIRERLLKYTLESKKEILSMEKPPYVAQTRATKEPNIVVPMRSIVQTSELNDAEVYEQLVLESKSGKQTRILEVVPLKYVIFDDRKLLIPLSDDPNNKEVIVNSNKDIIKYFIDTFNIYFERALPLEEYKNKDV